MTATADYMQALVLIRRLDRATQARLVAEVVQELAITPVSATTQTADPRATLAAVRAHFAALGPTTPSISEQLERDREERTAALEASLGEHHVHP